MASCAPAEEPEVKILSQTHDVEPDGSYKFAYETSDGSAREETGVVVNPGEENAYVSVKGSYRYTDPETSQVYEVQYTADENGFLAEGAHINEAIVKAVQAARSAAAAAPPA